jgi:hypothetical protein
MSSVRRWFWLKACVTEPRRIIVTFEMLAASSVVMKKFVLSATSDGAAVIVGRGPLKR